MNRLLATLCVSMSLLLWQSPAARATEQDDNGTFDQEEIVKKAEEYFGEASEGLASIIIKIFEDQGHPNAYITGDEIAGAVGVGIRYGKGALVTKTGGTQEVFWQGPSVGFDLGGNASKVFVLVYNLEHANQLYQRFPGVDGSFYVIAGFGVNYQRAEDVILAPIRTGVGLRVGASLGYANYTREPTWNPF